MDSVLQERGSKGRGLGLEAQQACRCLSGQGKHWSRSLPFLCTLPHCLPQGLPCPRWTPNHGWVPLGVGLLSSPSHPSGVLVLKVWPLLLLPLLSFPLPQDLCGWRGPWWAEDQARDLSRFLGAQVGRGNLATLPFDPLPSQWPSSFPLLAWDPSPLPQLPLRGASPILPPLLLPTHSPHTPHPMRSLGVPPVPLGVRGPPPVPGRCPSCAEMRIPRPPSPPS